MQSKGPKLEQAPAEGQALSTRNNAGGAATAGGVSFQAAITAIAGIRMLMGARLDWLVDAAKDVPVAIWAETGGPGDDIRLEIADGKVVEVQAKKGLQRGSDLWEAMISLATGVSTGAISYGVLAVAPDSSNTVRSDLPEDLRRLGDGRHDDLSSIGKELQRRLEAASLSVRDVCQAMRVTTVHALEHDRAQITHAKQDLSKLCAQPSMAEAAWEVICQRATAIMARRGRWTVASLVDQLSSQDIELESGTGPSGLLAKLCRWTIATHDTFTICGAQLPIPMKQLLPVRVKAFEYGNQRVESAEDALKRYRVPQDGVSQFSESVFDGAWTGRFFKHAVVVSGPGQGKSTLIRMLAAAYAKDSYPVLRVALKSVAAAMNRAKTFEETVFSLGLDGSSVSPEQMRGARFDELVLLCDGLDECGSSRQAVAEAIARFATGFPRARIVVTTRLIGYDTAILSGWRHYFLAGPYKPEQQLDLAHLMKAVAPLDWSEDQIESKVGAALKNASGNVLMTSKQMLGMTAVLLNTDGHLPDSRAVLYQRLIKLLLASAKAIAYPAPSAKSARLPVLYALGWVAIEAPVISLEATISKAAALVAKDLGCTAWDARETVEDALGFWKSVGLLEELNHDGSSLLAFVHNSFAEYAAACYVTARDTSQNHEVLSALMTRDAWREVMLIAVGLTNGDHLVQFFEVECANGSPKLLQDALGLIAEPDFTVSSGTATSVLQHAFKLIDAQPEQASELGTVLATLSAKEPLWVISEALKRKDASSYQIRLVAWACLTAAGISYYNFDELVSAIQALSPHFSKEVRIDALKNAQANNEYSLLKTIALSALQSLTEKDVVILVGGVLNHSAFNSVGFQFPKSSILLRRNIPDPSPFPRNILMSHSGLFGNATKKMMAAIPESSNDGTYVVLKNLCPGAVEEGNTSATLRTLNIGALLASCQIMQAVPMDIAKLEHISDPRVIREIFRVIMCVYGIDDVAVAAEARDMLRRREADPCFDPIAAIFPVADVPPPNWKIIKEVCPDMNLISSLAKHDCYWLYFLAEEIKSHEAAN